MSITITEALAEIKTIGKRIEKKRESMKPFMFRQDNVRDPLEKDGGSYEFIRRERQAVTDLENRVLLLRRSIQRANDDTMITINGTARSISDWLVWRRDVAPGSKKMIDELRGAINAIRDQARKAGVNLVSTGSTPQAPADIIVNINEAELAKEAETLEDTLGQLDGQLSLKNATVSIVE